MSSLPLEQLTTSLDSILSTIATDQLKTFDLIICHFDIDAQSLDSRLAALSRLKDMDAMLSLPKFRSLRSVQLIFWLAIIMQKYSVTSSSTPPPTSSNAAVLTFSSSSTKNAFARYARDVIQGRIKEELKQLNSRGILEANSIIWPQEQTSDVTIKVRLSRILQRIHHHQPRTVVE